MPHRITFPADNPLIPEHGMARKLDMAHETAGGSRRDGASSGAPQPSLGKPVKRSFFARSVHEVAPDLIGATLLFNGVGGVIVEVEAYHHNDPAAHSFRGPTPRNLVMFGPPGFSYVYRSYGIHWCVNFVCEAEGSASAVLIRALEPTHGLAAMRRRRGLSEARALCSGPGKLCAALGITIAHSELALDRKPYAIHARQTKVEVVSGVRIGLTKAVELPWRYGLKDSKFVSKPFPTTTPLRAQPAHSARTK
jgi:DNA-3-methyladenine glycosylase